MDFGLDRWNPYELTAPDGWESGDADTEYARDRGAAMDCVIWSLGPTGREPREAIEKRLGGE